MPLPPGTRVGPYEIIDVLGAGGMGEVYRARDARLQRDVAVKVLPELFARDPERLARFDREAQTLAALNHPNIAHIHGVEDTGSSRALVMELVAGEDLAERIQRGPVPLDEVLTIGRQIAEALEAAHERHVIHRDLKPANVRITPDGTVKVLDFGLAKALDPAGTAPGSVADFMSSPTFTSPAMTHMGVILGTASYMAPEQARGKPVDRRADIWALGVVLFELLTGKRLYSGETVTDTIAQVITQPPNFELLPAGTPPRVRRILRRCLEKDPRNRFHAAGDVRIEIEEAIKAPVEEGEGPVRPAPRGRALIPWVVAGVLALVAAFAWLRPSDAKPAAPSLRMDMRVGAGEEIVIDDNIDGALAVLTPDGKTLVYGGTRDTMRRLYVRPLNALQSTALSGTDGATAHFVSPDGRWVGFFASGTLKRMALTGGAPLVVADAPDTRGGTWGPDDTIVFTPTTTSGLVKVSAQGGAVEPVTTLGEVERSHRWPTFLPNGKAVLFIRQDHNTLYDDGVIEAVTLATRERKILVRGGTFPQYLPTGHLVYFREGTLFAVPFDPDRLELLGEAVPVMSGVLTSGGRGAGLGDGAAQFAVAADGTAVYIGGTSFEVLSRLVVVDRTGKQLFAYPDVREFRDPRFSPDGTRVAVQMPDGKSNHLYVIDLQRQTATKVTFDGTNNGLPVWSSDGTHLAYFSDRAGGGLNTYLTRADGGGTPEPLTSGTGITIPNSFSADGRLLALMKQEAGAMDVSILSLVDKKLTPFLSTPASELLAQFSPDSRWMLYQSDESGVPEVYVRPYPGPGGKWQISVGGGGLPAWTKSGREIVYVGGPAYSKVMAVDVAARADAVVPGTPRILFELPMVRPSNASWFDASPDGSRFAAIISDGSGTRGAGHTHVTLVTNFFDDVRRATAKQ